MEVRLKQTFIYKGQRYRRGVRELPDDVALPKGAEILDPAIAAKRASEAAKQSAQSADDRAKAAKEAAAKAASDAKDAQKRADEAEAEAKAEAKAKAERDAKEAKRTYADRNPQASLQL